MEKVKKSVKKYLILSLVFTVMFVAGIPAIILCATNGITWGLVLGIVATVLGFYGCPILWVNYGNELKNYRIANMIVEQNITDIAMLANNCGENVEEMRKTVNLLISKLYIKGFVLEGTTLKPTVKKQEVVDRVFTCPACGAKNGKSAKQCKYCGTEFE